MPSCWPWAQYGGNLFYYPANAFIDVYSPYVWNHPDAFFETKTKKIREATGPTLHRHWRGGLGPRWSLQLEDLGLYKPGLPNNEATLFTVELPGLWTPGYGLRTL